MVWAVLFCLLTPLWLSAQTGPRVVGILPHRQSMTPATDPDIVVRFDLPLDPASVDTRSVSVFGRWTGVCPGTFFFEEQNRQIRFRPAKPFSAGEWITVSLSREIRSMAGERMARGYAWHFWTATEPGVFHLTEKRRIPVRRPGEEPVETYGVYPGDLNGDGFHDLTVINEGASDIRVSLNDGRDHFADLVIYSDPGVSSPSPNEGADFNGDGWLDVAVGNVEGSSVTVFPGDGAGTFLQAVTYPTGDGPRGLCVLDLNGDGAVDIVTANRVSSDVSVLMNRGDGTFDEPVFIETGVVGETACAAADANEDGIPDVFVGSFDSGEIVLLLGDGDGHLSVGPKVDVRGKVWKIDVGDVDGDGHVDVVSANAVQNQFAVVRGDGRGDLKPATVYDTGGFPIAVDLGDLDGDGDLDLVTSNFSTADWSLFENNGKGKFRRFYTRLAAAKAGSCAVLHDRDRDGDLDMTGIDEIEDMVFLFGNSAARTDVADTLADSTGTRFELLQSYPNPFYATTGYLANRAPYVTIPFVLEQSAQVSLDLFNLIGQRVDRLIDEALPAGRYTVQIDGTRYTPGLYVYRLTVDGQTSTRKMILISDSQYRIKR
jgi:hypothetical protein